MTGFPKLNFSLFFSSLCNARLFDQVYKSFESFDDSISFIWSGRLSFDCEDLQLLFLELGKNVTF